MQAEKYEGWIFDAYPEREGMRVWIAGRDGRRLSVLDPWRPAFHLEGTLAQLKQAARVLASLNYPTDTAWVEKQGVDREKFTGFFNGSAIKMAEAAIGLQNAYDVEGTPALGVAGRFYIGGQGPRTMLIADSLIAEARKT